MLKVHSTSKQLNDLRPQTMPPMPSVNKPKNNSGFLICEHKMECIESDNGFAGKRCDRCRNNGSYKRKSFFEPI